MKPEQVAESAAHGVPRGNLSDLYPRWLGARELLRNGRNPYSAEVTREIQQGYYGRALDPARAEDPKDQEGFAYPAYVVFLLGPVTALPFDEVQTGFRWLLVATAAASVLLWLWVLRWPLNFGPQLILVVLLLGWLPMVQGLKLQQLTLLVAGLLAVSAACLSAGWLLCAGGLLALATIKPQLAWPLVLWLVVWAACEWRSRWKFLFGFGLVMSLLLVGAEIVLPGWWGMFFTAIGQYHQYTQNQSVMVWLFGSIAGHALEALCIVACGWCVWGARGEPARSEAFGTSLALVLALTALVVPMSAPYNQVLLLPAILVLVRRATSGEPLLPAVRLANIVAVLFVIWPWIASLGLCAAYLWLTPQVRARVYLLPFYSNFEVPVLVFGLALLDSWMNHARGLRDPATAE
jgi:hypothetical protein